MECINFRRHHAGWREGRRASLDVAMREHAAACPSCGRYDRALRIGTDLLRRGEIEPSAGFAERLARRIREAPALEPDAVDALG